MWTNLQCFLWRSNYRSCYQTPQSVNLMIVYGPKSVKVTAERNFITLRRSSSLFKSVKGQSFVMILKNTLGWVFLPSDGHFWHKLRNLSEVIDTLIWSWSLSIQHAEDCINLTFESQLFVYIDVISVIDINKNDLVSDARNVS